MFFQEFDEALLEAVDFAFCFLGRSTREAVYFNLEMAFCLPRLQIPLRLEEFDEARCAVFSCCAGFLEELFLRRLCETLEVEVIEDDDFDFVELVTRIESVSSSIVALVPSFSELASTTKKTGR
jgi:hypothetical protein